MIKMTDERTETGHVTMTTNTRQPRLRETADRLLTSQEVAELFRVDPKTVARWAKRGRIPSVRTPGGHHRFPRTAVMRLLSQIGEQQ